MPSNSLADGPRGGGEITCVIRELQAEVAALTPVTAHLPEGVQRICERISELGEGLGGIAGDALPAPPDAGRFQRLLDALPARVALLDAAGVIQAVNQSWRGCAGWHTAPGTELSPGGNYLAACEADTGSGRETFRAMAAGVREVLARRQAAFTLEYPFHSPAARRWFRFDARPWCADDGGGAILTHTEVTKERQSVEAARRLSQAVEQSPASIVITNLSGEIEYVNPKFSELTGYSRAEITGQNPSRLKGGETPREVYDELWKTIRGGGVWRGELHNRKKNGELFWEFASISAVMDAEGRACNFLAVKEDITARKEAAAAMARALAEKEVLLKEIHHRVKNNLQVVCSLLAMQSEADIHEAARLVLREAQNRVRAMAMIHEKLYQSDTLAHVDFGEYVRSLSGFLFRCYADTTNRVKLKVSAGDVRLNIDTASPCGLILNELISNSLKHAFPGGREGELRVDLQVEANGYSLTVADDGVGLPAGCEPSRAGSLGMQLIETLARQIKGRLSLRREGGCSFRLEFNEL